MKILGIETSCDETAICLLEINEGKYKIIENVVNSQIEIHRPYGGVFPMLAKREHLKNLPLIYDEFFKKYENKIDQIAVTYGPGLEPALWTGILFAKELSKNIGKPLIPINHMEGHILSTLLTEKNEDDLKSISMPALAILLSGGHTEMINVKSIGDYALLGKTLDDAVGEAFDKVARMLSLPYPGGPEISRLAEAARKEDLISTVSLPRPMLHSKNLDFSFSGLKTSVVYLLKEIGAPSDQTKKEICREFEDAVTEVLIHKASKAIKSGEYKSIIMGGGVVANKHIRNAFEKLAKEESLNIYLPPKDATGDNAIMIALASFFNTKKPSEEGFSAKGNLTL